MFVSLSQKIKMTNSQPNLRAGARSKTLGWPQQTQPQNIGVAAGVAAIKEPQNIGVAAATLATPVPPALIMYSKNFVK